MSASSRIAILFQKAPLPILGGVVKPPKPNGYRDSSADIAFNLRSSGWNVITPVDNPDPTVESDWSFGDTEEGVLEAVKAGANILWANTTLHSTCSLVTLKDKLQADLRFVGQDPFDFEKYEDKAWLNDWLNQGELEGWFPRSWLVRNTESEKLKSVELPAVVKPVRGRGSHGVSLVRTDDDLVQRVNELWTESDLVLIEVYCPDEEITITIMPPGTYKDVGRKDKHWALPVVTRFNHKDGIAPYNGVVPVSANSKVVSKAAHERDKHYRDIQDRTALIGERLKSLAPIRVDCRRKEPGSKFYMFDINMKPNTTGPGRPGRDDQASLVLLAAREIGWDYPTLLEQTIRQARKLRDVVETHDV